MRTMNIAVLPGDGVGPEVTAEALKVVRAVVGDENVSATEYPFGGSGLDDVGDPFPPETRNAVRSADAVLLGAVGGPRWDGVALARRPEAGLLSLRGLLDVFANLRPVVVGAGDVGLSPLRSAIAANVDLVIVRELTSGIYFGEPRWYKEDIDDPTALDSMVYSKSQIVRIARIAFEQARERRGRVTSIDKANVLASSRLWRATVSEVHRSEFPDVVLDHLYVDNAAMQLVTKPSSFDVMLCGNLFGDILSDLAAVLPGSIGLLPSASIGSEHGLFEPVHGSAPDIAGKGIANPVGCILSAAMLLDYVGAGDAGDKIRSAVARVRADGYATQDLLHGNNKSVTTSQFGDLVAERVASLVAN